MLVTLNEAKKLIETEKWFHVAGNENVLGQLPRGNWIGGTTEYFIDAEGGVVSDEKLFVKDIPFSNCKIAEYDENDIASVTKDAFENGFSIIILPFDSKVHHEYAKNAAGFEDMFIKNIIGWVAGFNLTKEGQKPFCFNGKTGEHSSKNAVVMHVALPEDQLASINIVNIFEQKEDSPLIEFKDNSFSVTTCLINGKEMLLAEYIAQQNVDTKLPLVGEYSGSGVNVSIKDIKGDTVYFYAPVFEGIKYRFANPVKDYAKEFQQKMDMLDKNETLFSCNCILNFMYGGLEGKKIQGFYGPVTFGEVAYQLVNQTLVYLTINR